ncbi:hypothetical protein GOP47_0009973 [Adiantum capillus-veneris]|uniref:Uncharacterized protein n=1 Tax=Adiantum capillus-veneris TaxID=13818 RepID=A0A9D4UYR8_ADICA|nr:hypothetical protein GOP47_0009973 [Adiantum capillus-veneris]
MKSSPQSTEISLVYAWKSFSVTSISNPLKSFVVPVDVTKPFNTSDVFNPTARPHFVVPGQGISFTPHTILLYAMSLPPSSPKMTSSMSLSWAMPTQRWWRGCNLSP